MVSGTFVSGPLALRDAALFTDLYEITMAASYFRERMTGPATFSLFVRRLPPGRSFLVAAGLEDVLAFLEDFRFSSTALEYLRSLQRFDPAFLRYLGELRFTGDVRAVPEGTVVFADEPLLELTAPIAEAQLVETAILNSCHFQTVVASKAARCVLAARGRAVVEFGLRRAPGTDGGMKAARCAFLAGAAMTSNVLAALSYGIPPTGTMAHSYVTAFPREIESFRAFARAFPSGTTLLIDTYDTVTGAHQAAQVGREMAARGERLAGVRLDSGDLGTLSKEVRRILDDAGLHQVKIFASGGLDEDDIDRLLEQGAPIDSFGVGTRMDVAADAPYLDMAYKLVKYAGRHVLKTSEGKKTWTGEKQVYRFRGPDRRFAHDLVALHDEPAAPEAEALLRPVMRGGKMLAPLPPLRSVRDHSAAQVAALPDDVRRFRGGAAYPIRFGDRLTALQREVEAELRRSS
ncbi:MAG TPA: nicotinate phosphoribosyltransferase [Gemmatimonadales bacterium]|nr:nicotinate phosphoribosyltransferase [Gemmatimonadales bacterium]